MTNDRQTAATNNDQLERLRASREAPVVLKLELAKLRGDGSTQPVFVMEGNEDKLVYSQWLRRARANLVYKMLVAKGKGTLLGLRSLLEQDQTGLATAVYFLVDRDFDELRGQALGDDVFLTECYSVENYLVCEQVLEEVLDVVFHCHAAEDVKRQILVVFADVYNQFLSLTRTVNLRLFIARKLGMKTNTISVGISKLVNLSFDQVGAGRASPAEIIVLEKEVTALDPAIASEFEGLVPQERYRGKFAYSFFANWLKHLASQVGEQNRGVFSTLPNHDPFDQSQLTLSYFASVSPLPKGLEQFVARIP